MKNLVSKEYLDKIYEALGEMIVVLDSDPLTLGPKTLNEKIAKVGNYRTEVSHLQTQVSKLLQERKRAYRVLKFELDRKVNSLAIEDDIISSLKTRKERVAAARKKFKDLSSNVQLLESAVEDLSDLMSILKIKRADLKDTETRLKEQIQMCKEERILGSQWGKGPVRGGMLGMTKPKDQVRDIIGDIDQALNLPEVNGDDELESFFSSQENKDEVSLDLS